MMFGCISKYISELHEAKQQGLLSLVTLTYMFIELSQDKKNGEK